MSFATLYQGVSVTFSGTLRGFRKENLTIAAVFLVVPFATWAQDWGAMATISSTMGIQAGRLCLGEASRGDIGCPVYAPSVTSSGHVSVTGNVSAAKFIGDGSGLTGISGNGDRITSGTTSVTAQSGGVVSITTSGVTTNYFNASGLLITPGISVTTANGISSTNGYFSGKIGIGTAMPAVQLEVSSTGNSQLRLSSAAGPYALIGAYDASGPGLDPSFDIHLMGGDSNTAHTMRFFRATSTTGPVNLQLMAGNGTTNAGANINTNNTGHTWFAANGGNVGIGTTTPLTALHVSSDVAINNDNSALFTTNGHNHVGISAADGYDAILSLQEAGSHRWRLSNKGTDDRLVLRNQSTTEVFTVLQSGKVGIGTASPKATLEVSGSISLGSGALYLPYKAGSDSLTTSYAGLKAAVGADSSLLTLTDATDIGLSNQETVIMLADNEVNNDDGLSVVRWNNSGFHSVPFRMRGSGYIGLNGILLPSYPLDVSGTVRATTFIGDGSNLTNLTGDNLGNHTATQNLGLGTNAIVFGNSIVDKIYLYSNTYGIGMESSNLTNWSASSFRWRVGGTSVSAGTQVMLLNTAGLTISGSVLVNNTGDLATAPSYSWSGDTNTGMYWVNNDQIGVTTGGTQRLLVNSSGLRVVGYVSTTGILDAGGPIYGYQGDSVTAPGYTWSGDTNTGMYWVGADQLGLTVGGVQQLLIRSTGVVVSGSVLANNVGDVATAPSYSWSGDTNTGLYWAASDQIGVATGGAQRLLVNSTGLTVTGRVSTTGLIDAGGPIYGFQNDSVTAPGYTWSGDTNTGMYWVGADQLGLTAGGVQRLLVNSSGLRVTGAITTVGGNVTVDGVLNASDGVSIGNGSFVLSGSRDIASAIAGGQILIQDSTTSNSGSKVRIDVNELQAQIDGGVGTYTLNPFGGQVNIGSAGFGANLVVRGTGTTCTIGFGTGATSCSSDRRLKQDIHPLPGSLEKITALQGVQFKWRKNPSETRIGLIAQDVEKQFPEVVETDPDTGMKSVAYPLLVAPLIEAVKELKTDNRNLRKSVERLRADNDNLRVRLERLEAHAR